MPICVVLDIETNELINTIIADPTDPAPQNTKLVEVPEGYYWNVDTKQLEIFN